MIQPVYVTSLALALSLAGGACGGKAQPTTPSNTASGSGAASGGDAARGTTGVPGLDWGASADQVRAVQPRATADKAGLVYLGTVEKRQAIVHYTIEQAGLQKIEVEFTDGYPTMEVCSEHWKELRTAFDGRFGASQADNLAAYWTTPTASITLTCGPNESGAGVLAIVYTPPEQ